MAASSETAAGIRPALIDAVFAVVLSAAASVELILGRYDDTPTAVLALAALVTTLPIAFRSEAPELSAGLTTWAWALAVILGFPPDDPLVPALAPLVAVYSLGAVRSGRRLVMGVGLVLLAYAVALAGSAPAIGAIGILLPAAALALAAGVAVRVMGFEADTLAEKASQLELERDEVADSAAASERARIARELHDIIGHSISVMGIQAGAVRRRLTGDQAKEREMLLGVERIGRDAVAEMKDLLGLLRGSDDQASHSVPSLERIVALVEEMRTGGMEVTLMVDGDLDGLPAARSATVFRVLQEALTNSLKHAPGSSVDARLSVTDTAVEIRVADTGAVGNGPSSGAGHGLIGMRERVALYGGSFAAGPEPGGGFAVRVQIPVLPR